MKPLCLVVAVSRNGVIGRNGQLPWHLPEDLKHFKATTLGHAIIMGRKTFESIGRPLPGRRNIAVSRTLHARIELEVVNSLDEAVALARATDPEPMVIGGAQLYAEALPLVTRVVMTQVERDVEGDAFFKFDPTGWREVSRRSGDGVFFLEWVRT